MTDSPSLDLAWIEPGTASLFLYCSTLLLRGRTGARVLARHLRRGRETLADVALDEFSDFMCDHPDVLLTVLLLSTSVLPGQDGAPRCRLVARAPSLLRSTRSLSRSTRTLARATVKNLVTRIPSARSRDQLLHLLQRPRPGPGAPHLQQAQAEPHQPVSICLCSLPAHPPRLPVLLRRAGRGKGPALYLLCQLAAAGVWWWAQKAGKETHAADGSGGSVHAPARNHPLP